MDAQEIVKISPESIRELLRAQSPSSDQAVGDEQRRTPRWPFPGTVEIWLPDDAFGERHVLATLHNLSPVGLAMRTRRAIHAGTRISLAIHQPELSCYGHAMVRHCTRSNVGYLIGVELIFESGA